MMLQTRATRACESNDARVVRQQNNATCTATTRAGENDEARIVRRHNNALCTAERRTANLTFHNFWSTDVMPKFIT